MRGEGLTRDKRGVEQVCVCCIIQRDKGNVHPPYQEAHTSVCEGVPTALLALSVLTISHG